MRVGFTGTRDGMTHEQRLMFGALLVELSPTHLHHGDCVGADAQAHDIAEALGVLTEAHPCDMEWMRAHRRATVVHDPKPPLDRNVDIVDLTLILIAAVKGPEERRSGTWSTVRYARRLGRPILIVWPDGKVTREGC